MKTLGVTHSVCPTCRRLVPAKIVADESTVYFDKFCTEHGTSRVAIRSDPADYMKTLRHVKPAWIPEAFAGNTQAACPDGCGMCERHEQHLCMPIVEITSRCDLACPVCLVDAGQPWDMSLAEFDRLLDVLIAAERQIDILNLSGGEPLLHPAILEIVDRAIAREEIVRVSISTNGLQLLERPELVDALQQRGVVISLQFDGFTQEIYQTLRGRPLLDEKLRLVDLLGEADISTSLTMTAVAGVNDDQFPAMLEYYFDRPHLVSMMIQPLAIEGRARNMETERLSIPDIIRLLDNAGMPEVSADDFSPLPCSHPLCFSLAFFLILDDGGRVSLSRLLDASRQLDLLANRTVFGLDAAEQDQIKDLIYELWSGPVGAAPDSDAILRTLRSILDDMACDCFDPRRAFSTTERRVKSIFIHAFQDADTFDLARVRRCCNGYPQPDGRIIPACVHNVRGRHRAAGEEG